MYVLHCTHWKMQAVTHCLVSTFTMPSEYPTAKFASSSCKAPMRCKLHLTLYRPSRVSDYFIFFHAIVTISGHWWMEISGNNMCLSSVNSDFPVLRRSMAIGKRHEKCKTTGSPWNNSDKFLWFADVTSTEKHGWARGRCHVSTKQ